MKTPAIGPFALPSSTPASPRRRHFPRSPMSTGEFIFSWTTPPGRILTWIENLLNLTLRNCRPMALHGSISPFATMSAPTCNRLWVELKFQWSAESQCKTSSISCWGQIVATNIGWLMGVADAVSGARQSPVILNRLVGLELDLVHSLKLISWVSTVNMGMDLFPTLYTRVHFTNSDYIFHSESQ